LLLEVLFRLTGHAILADYAEAWKVDRLSTPARTEIFLTFLLTKNVCRLRNRTWRFNKAKVHALATGQAEPWMPEKAAASSDPA